MNDNHQANGLLGLLKHYPKQVYAALLVAVALFFLVVMLGGKPASMSSNDAEAVAARIQKVGAVEIKDANRAAHSGEEVFKAQCSACHATGAAGSPKFGDASAWGPRIGKGFDALWNSALKGKGNMGPQGGGNFEDFEIGRGVAYMANAGGAKFAEPKQPEAK
jgi:cytochrome c5